MSRSLHVLEEARQAAARRDWKVVAELLAGPSLAPDASADVLELAGDASWWLGRLDKCIAARERAYAAHLEADEPRPAARVAMLLHDNNCFLGRRAVAGGWLGRARRLLEGDEGSVERGWLLLREGETAHAVGDLDQAAERFRAAVVLGRRVGDADVEAEGLQAIARILISEGKPAEGLALFDEAMLSAVEGKLDPFTVGKVYCSLISACEELGDLPRAREWTEAGVRWAERDGWVVFPGLCRVHRAEVLQLHGDWAEAEAEARQACIELDDVNVGNAAAAHYEVGEIRRRIGDLEGAAEAFRRVDALGGNPQPGLALLQLAQGKVTAAAAGIAAALAGQTWNRLARAKLLPAQVQVAIAAGDLDGARAAAEELEAIAAEFGSSGLAAAAATATGRLLLAADDVPAACATLRHALTLWQELDVPYEVASVRVLLGVTCGRLGDDEGASSSFTVAADLFARLGAALDARRIDELRGAPTPLPDGLTAREAEVLRLVAEGRTNRDVAAALFLSEKTVARHLSNIFVKTGVTSRAGATAYAFERGIVALSGDRPSP